MAQIATTDNLRIKQQISLLIHITIEIIIIIKYTNHHLRHHHHPPPPPPQGDSNTTNSHINTLTILLIKPTKPTVTARVPRAKTRMIITILNKGTTTIRTLMAKIVNITKNHHLLHMLLNLTSIIGETTPISTIIPSLNLPHLILLLQAELF